MKIRTERAHDAPAIRRLLTAAFDGGGEADLVDALRADGDAVLSLVATISDAASESVIGHVMLSRLSAPLPAVALAPVAVDAAHRAQGVAAALIEAALAEARAQGECAVFVLGDPDYYRRFGFDAALAKGFECAYAGPYLMARMLSATDIRTGALTYPAAFARL